MEFPCDETQLLNKQELLNYLSTYYSILYRKEITVLEEHWQKTYDKVGLNIYFYDTVMDEEQKIILSDDEIKTALMEYAFNLGYDLVKFKYVGFVRRVGYFTESDSAFFDGVKLYLNHRGKKLTKKKS